LKLAKTTIGLFYEYQTGNPFSYTYAGDMNGDGSGGGGNDLIYVPKDASEIKLLDFKRGTETVTAATQWANLEAYINQDPYLSTRKGQYAERNGAFGPNRGQLDLSFKQDFYINIGGKRNTLQFSADVFNASNQVFQNVNRAGLINFIGYDASKTPTFNFTNLDTTPSAVGTNPLKSTFFDNKGIGSRWQGQFGLRYIFN
jgi:hypothetical protein